MIGLLRKIVRVIQPRWTHRDSDAVNRKLRLLSARIERLEESVSKAQRRADSAWSAVTRVQSSVNERLAEVPSSPVGQVQNNSVPKIKAGTSMKDAIAEYNRSVTGGS